jgi:predicted nucleic acid-binding protein
MALPRTYLSSVVAAELRAGAHDDAGRGLIDHLVFRFERVRRVIAPSAASWYDVGDALARVARREPGMRSKVHTLWNDALIAVSARQVGAAVVSDNVRDFTLLRRYLRFEIEGGS